MCYNKLENNMYRESLSSYTFIYSQSADSSVKRLSEATGGKSYFVSDGSANQGLSLFLTEISQTGQGNKPSGVVVSHYFYLVTMVTIIFE